MTFENWIVTVCDRFLAERTFELIVAPALADCEFEAASGRGTRFANRAALVRAAAGGFLHDFQRGSDVFFKLVLFSVSYFMFPVALSMTAFKTWSAFFGFASMVIVMSITPRTPSGAPTTSWPPMRTSPASAASSVERICTVVVLPEPLGPSRPKISPRYTWRSSALSAWTFGRPQKSR